MDLSLDTPTITSVKGTQSHSARRREAPALSVAPAPAVQRPKVLHEAQPKCDVVGCLPGKNGAAMPLCFALVKHK